MITRWWESKINYITEFAMFTWRSKLLYIKGKLERNKIYCLPIGPVKILKRSRSEIAKNSVKIVLRISFETPFVRRYAIACATSVPSLQIFSIWTNSYKYSSFSTCMAKLVRKTMLSNFADNEYFRITLVRINVTSNVFKPRSLGLGWDRVTKLPVNTWYPQVWVILFTRSLEW